MTIKLTLALLAPAGAYALTVVLLARRYRLPESRGQRVRVALPATNTTIVLHRHRPSEQKFREPVILRHGLGANRFNLDLTDDGTGSERSSLARCLCSAGFDVWLRRSPVWSWCRRRSRSSYTPSPASSCDLSAGCSFASAWDCHSGSWGESRGSDDVLCRVAAFERAAARFGHDDVTLRVLGTATDCGVEYAHASILLGPTAPDEVFPLIREWLEERAT